MTSASEPGRQRRWAKAAKSTKQKPTTVTARIWINGRWTAQRLTGTQRYASEIVRGIPADVADRCVLALPRDGVVPDYLSPAVRVVRSRWRGQFFDQVWLPVRSAGAHLLTLSGPGTLLKRRQVMVLHDASPFAIAGSFGRAFGLYYRASFRWLSRVARDRVTVSAFSRAELARYTGSAAGRFRIVPCGADHITRGRPDERVLERLDGAPFVLFVGSQVAHKNIGVLYEQLSRLDVTVAVVGDAPTGNVFRGVGGRSSGNVRWLGRVSEDELACLYARAGCVVFPSRYEGFGLPVVEAQAMGCPVVHSDQASLPEVAGGAGLQVAVDEPDGFLHAVRRVLRDGALREDLVARGRRNAQRFVWAESAAALLEPLTREAVSAGALR